MRVTSSSAMRRGSCTANALIAAAFDHYDSRSRDPNLHTHVAVRAKVQGTDGRWLSLDARFS